MDLLLTKVKPKSLAAETHSLKCTSCSSKPLSRSPPEYSLDNMTTYERRRARSLHSLKKKKPRFVPIQPLPSSLRGTAVEKHVWYAQQVPANSSETLLTNLKKKTAPLSPPPVPTRDQKRECWHIRKNSERLDDEIKWNFYCISLVWVPLAGCAA